MNSSGMNTATSDRLIDSTVKPTSRAPSSAALKRSMPASMWRLVFSSTTMASSTTKPVATVSAIRLRLFSEKPSRYITPKVPSSDTTVATAGMMVARTLRRKALTTSTTSGDGDQQRDFDLVQRGADRVGAVGGDLQLDVLRQLVLQLGQQGAHAVDGLDDVGAGLQRDQHDHRRLAVEQAQRVDVLHAVRDLGDVGQADRGAVAPGHDQAAVVRRGRLASPLPFGRAPV